MCCFIFIGGRCWIQRIPLHARFVESVAVPADSHRSIPLIAVSVDCLEAVLIVLNLASLVSSVNEIHVNVGIVGRIAISEAQNSLDAVVFILTIIVERQLPLSFTFVSLRRNDHEGLLIHADISVGILVTQAPLVLSLVAREDDADGFPGLGLGARCVDSLECTRVFNLARIMDHLLRIGFLVPDRGDRCGRVDYAKGGVSIYSRIT